MRLPHQALTRLSTWTAPFGLSIVPFLIVAGLLLIGTFARWERRVAARGGDTLVDLSMLRLPQLRAGLGTMSVMFLCLGGIFFLMPLYLQIVLGKDPLETGSTSCRCRPPSSSSRWAPRVSPPRWRHGS